MPALDHADEQMRLPSTPPCGVADACGNEHALETVLKSQLDFRGFVMSDWWAVHSTEAAKGGVDQNQPGNDGYFSGGTENASNAFTHERTPRNSPVLPSLHLSSSFLSALPTIVRSHT